MRDYHLTLLTQLQNLTTSQEFLFLNLKEVDSWLYLRQEFDVWKTVIVAKAPDILNLISTLVIDNKKVSRNVERSEYWKLCYDHPKYQRKVVTLIAMLASVRSPFVQLLKGYVSTILRASNCTYEVSLSVY